MSSPTNINLNDTVPPPKPDAFNAEVQAGAPYPDPNVPGAVVRDASLCYRTPQVGGVLVLTDIYDLGGPDAGFTFVCNSASPFTVTHPAVIPVLPNPQGIWNFKLINLGAGTVTLDLNGLNLDGSGTNPTYTTGQGADISTDGTDLYTCLSSGTGGGSSPNFSDAEVPTPAVDGTTTVFTLANTPLATPIVEQDNLMPTRGASSLGYTLTGSPARTLTFTDPPLRSLHVWYRY